MLIKPKEVAVKDADGVEKTFIISRLPAITGGKFLPNIRCPMRRKSVTTKSVKMPC